MYHVKVGKIFEEVIVASVKQINMWNFASQPDNKRCNSDLCSPEEELQGHQR